MNIKNVSFLGFVFCLFVTFLFVVSFLQYDILTRHDLYVPFARSDFFHPEHGRYIATFVNNMITVKIPTILNYNVQDFQSDYVLYFKAFLTVLIIVFITNSLYTFAKSKLSFPITYVFCFLLFFNFPFIDSSCSTEDVLFENTETTVFLEYFVSIILYYIFWQKFAKYFVENKFPDKKDYIILLVTSFFLGISVEILNVPVFLMLIVFGIYLLIKNRKTILNINKTPLVLSVFGYVVYFLSLFLYYLQTNKYNKDNKQS